MFFLEWIMSAQTAEQMNTLIIDASNAASISSLGGITIKSDIEVCASGIISNILSYCECYGIL